MAGSAAAVAAQLMVARPRMHPDVAVQAHVAPPPLPWGDRTTNEPTRSDLRCYECTGCAFYFDARPGQNDECPVCGDWVQRPLPDPPRPAGAGQARATPDSPLLNDYSDSPGSPLLNDYFGPIRSDNIDSDGPLLDDYIGSDGPLLNDNIEPLDVVMLAPSVNFELRRSARPRKLPRRYEPY